LNPMNPDDMLLFKEAAEWINLTAALREEGPPPNQVYWDTLIEGVLGSRFTAPAAWKIYRARVMPLERELDAEPLAAEDMVPPPPALAPAGRLNPSGVSYFYGALEPETAIAEARPWRRARISVARFSSTTELALADLTGDFTTSERGSQVKWLSFMLARPVHRDDAEAYLASQRVAQECRAAGLSGVLYDSSLQPGGVNVALFAHDRLDCEEIELHEVTGVSYTAQRLWP